VARRGSGPRLLAAAPFQATPGNVSRPPNQLTVKSPTETSGPTGVAKWTWRRVWVTTAVVALGAFFSLNWSRLPGAAVPHTLADSLYFWVQMGVGALLIVGTAASVPLAAALLLVALWQKEHRGSMTRVAITLVLSIAGVWGLAYAGRPTVEVVASRWVAWRGRAIITALERYHAEHGRYPRSLDQLQPRYLRRIPTPALLGSPEFSYETPETPGNRFSPRPGSYDLHAWFYGVSDVPSLHYRPERRYPKRMGDGKLLWRLGDWAYVWTERGPLWSGP